MPRRSLLALAGMVTALVVAGQIPAGAEVIGTPRVVPTLAPPVPTPKATPQASVPMSCEVGTMDRVQLFQDGGYFIFKLSAGPVASGLQPGQCAFEDRAISSSEPGSLCFKAAFYTLDYAGLNQMPLMLFTGPGSNIMHAVLYGPTKLMNFVVHRTANCFAIDTYGV